MVQGRMCAALSCFCRPIQNCTLNLLI